MRGELPGTPDRTPSSSSIFFFSLIVRLMPFRCWELDQQLWCFEEAPSPHNGYGMAWRWTTRLAGSVRLLLLLLPLLLLLVFLLLLLVVLVSEIFFPRDREKKIGDGNTEEQKTTSSRWRQSRSTMIIIIIIVITRQNDRSVWRYNGNVYLEILMNSTENKCVYIYKFLQVDICKGTWAGLSAPPGRVLTNVYWMDISV